MFGHQLVQLRQHGPEEGPHVLGVRVAHDEVAAGGLGIGRLEQRHADADEILAFAQRTGHAGVPASAAVAAVEEDQERVLPGRIVVDGQEDRHLRLHVLLLYRS